MTPNVAAFENYTVNEEIRIDFQKDMRSETCRVLNAFSGRDKVASISFTGSHELVRVASFQLFDDGHEGVVEPILFEALRCKFPDAAFSVYRALEDCEWFQDMVNERRPSLDHVLASQALAEFEASCLEAAARYEHMSITGSGFNARLEFYGRYPLYLRRDEHRLSLADRLEASSVCLYRFRSLRHRKPASYGGFI